MPRFSVITIARNERDLDNLKSHLSGQRFRDFEFVFSTKGTIPEAWNDAITRSKGDFLVFTESDAWPLQDTWLEEINDRVRENVVMKGIEITPADLDMCNLVCDRRIFDTMRFDERFPVGEDTELFARMRKSGILIERVPGFPVVHKRRESWQKTVTRACSSGRYAMKIIYLHGRLNVDSVNTRNMNGDPVNPVSNRLRIIVHNVLFLTGLCIGLVQYFPLVFLRKK
jgi:GT2 family glycosyltransferase